MTGKLGSGPRKSLTEQIAGQRTTPALPHDILPTSDNAPSDMEPPAASNGYKAFSTMNTSRQHVPKLQFRLMTGRRLSLDYSYFPSATYEPGRFIQLEFVSQVVTLTGRNLDGLYDALDLHKVRWIQEVDPRYEPPEDVAVVVSAIRIQSREEWEKERAERPETE